MYISSLSLPDYKQYDHIMWLCSMSSKFLSSGAVGWIDLVEPAQAVPVPQVVVVPPGPAAGTNGTAEARAWITSHVNEAAPVLSLLDLLDVGNPVFASIRNLGDNGLVYLDQQHSAWMRLTCLPVKVVVASSRRNWTYKVKIKSTIHQILNPSNQRPMRYFENWTESTNSV